MPLQRGALGKTLTEPPARLEKNQLGNEEVGDFTMKDMKLSAEAKKQVHLLCILPVFAFSPETLYFFYKAS